MTSLLVSRSTTRLMCSIVAAGSLAAAAGCGGGDADDADGVAAEETTLVSDPGTTSPSTSTTGPSTSVPAATTTTGATTVPAVSSTAAPTTVAADPPLRVLVTNDDGVDSPGLQAVVDALRAFPDRAIDVTIVAPVENQSGTSNTVSDPPPDRTVDVVTASGDPALAVDGTPADSVNVALDVVFDDPPDLVVSGSNDGQNIGPFASLSGTVGAARTAAVRGVPAIAVSQGGVTVEPEHEVGVEIFVDWFTENYETLLDAATPIAAVWTINTPSCAGRGSVRGVLELPVADEFEPDVNPFEVDCTSTRTDVADDASAFLSGYATITRLPEELVIAPPPQ